MRWMRTALRAGAKTKRQAGGLGAWYSRKALVGRCKMKPRGAALLLVAALVTGLTKQLAVLLLRHTLATLFDY